MFKCENEKLIREYKMKKIDQLVYQLYDLTEDEIKVVEGE